MHVEMRDDIKASEGGYAMRPQSIVDGWRRILVDGQILQILDRRGGWGATLGMIDTVQDNDGVWSYIGKRGEQCVFFEDGNYLPRYRVVPYVLA